MFFWSFLRLLFPYFSWQQFSYLVSRAVGTVGGGGAIPPYPFDSTGPVLSATTEIRAMNELEADRKSTPP